jgi:phage-related protein
VNTEQIIYLRRFQFLSRLYMSKTISCHNLQIFLKKKVGREKFAWYIKSGKNGGKVTCLKTATNTESTNTSL